MVGVTVPYNSVLPILNVSTYEGACTQPYGCGPVKDSSAASRIHTPLMSMGSMQSAQLRLLLPVTILLLHLSQGQGEIFCKIVSHV